VTEADRDRVRSYVRRLDDARRTRAREIADDVDPVRALSMRERGEWIASVCRSAWSILASRPDAQRIVAMREEPAADFRPKWDALMAALRSKKEPSS
jgi:hypothetical protein